MPSKKRNTISEVAFHAAAEAAENTTNKMMSTRNIPLRPDAIGNLSEDQRAEERAGNRSHSDQTLERWAEMKSKGDQRQGHANDEEIEAIQQHTHAPTRIQTLRWVLVKGVSSRCCSNDLRAATTVLMGLRPVERGATNCRR